ncbi:hypothetical protein Bca4012_031772 [Brassica carinata]
MTDLQVTSHSSHGLRHSNPRNLMRMKKQIRLKDISKSVPERNDESKRVLQEMKTQAQISRRRNSRSNDAEREKESRGPRGKLKENVAVNYTRSRSLSLSLCFSAI